MLYGEDIAFSKADVIFLTNAVMSKKKKKSRKKNIPFVFIIISKRLLPVPILLPALTPFESQVCIASHRNFVRT